MTDVNNTQYKELDNIVIDIYLIGFPIKHKHIRTNNTPFMKVYKRAVMVRSKLRNKYNKGLNMQSLLGRKMKRNIYTYLLRKIKYNF